MRKVDREAYLNSMREIDIHKTIKHPNIVQLIEIVDDQDDDKVYLIMEAAHMGQIMTHSEGKFMPVGRSYQFSEPEIVEYSK